MLETTKILNFLFYTKICFARLANTFFKFFFWNTALKSIICISHALFSLKPTVATYPSFQFQTLQILVWTPFSLLRLSPFSSLLRSYLVAGSAHFPFLGGFPFSVGLGAAQLGSVCRHQLITKHRNTLELNKFSTSNLAMQDMYSLHFKLYVI